MAKSISKTFIENLYKNNQPNYGLINSFSSILDKEKNQTISNLLIYHLIEKKVLNNFKDLKNYDKDSKDAIIKLLASIIGEKNTTKLTTIKKGIIEKAEKKDFVKLKAEKKKKIAKTRGSYSKPHTEEKKKAVLDFLRNLQDEYVFMVPGKTMKKKNIEEPIQCFKVCLSKINFCNMYNENLENDEDLQINYKQMIYILRVIYLKKKKKKKKNFFFIQFLLIFFLKKKEKRRFCSLQIFKENYWPVNN
jgi:hypothetical protein